MVNSKCIIYIGDFDFRNENVQSFLVKNNGRVLNLLGYKVTYIGVNRKVKDFHEESKLQPVELGDGNLYFELPDTLNIVGLLKYGRVCRKIIEYLDLINMSSALDYVITYQSPTYATVIKKILKWCKNRDIRYVVNCADLPTFKLQSLPKRLIMKANWGYLHKINKKYADGVISVSEFIDRFYYKYGRKSIIIPPLFDTTDCECYITLRKENVTFIYAGTPFKNTGKITMPEGMKDRLDKIIDLFLALSFMGIDYNFHIIGITKDDYLVGVPRHRIALKDEPRIVFLGQYSHRETLGMVGEADFSINYRDANQMTLAGFSTKIVESVSLGTPVIINSISDTFNYLEKGVSGFVLEEDFEKNKQLLIYLCRLPADMREALKFKCFNLKTFENSRYKEVMETFLQSL